MALLSLSWLFGLIALVWSMDLLHSPERGPRTSMRVLASFALLLVAFGIGTCNVGAFASIGPEYQHEFPYLKPVLVVSCVLLAALTAIFLAIIRRSSDAASSHRRNATTGVVLLAAAAMLALLAAYYLTAR